ncbi:MAG: hypothetical protein ACYS83_05310 [Planctomycetota bacterium]|jgi:hypothetical protein
MQNKANLPDYQMNVSGTITKDYENKTNWKLGKNKANTKPLKPNLPDAQTNVTLTITKHYENVRLRGREKNKPNQTQFQSHRLSKLFLFFTFLCPSYNLGKTKIAKIFLASIVSPFQIFFILPLFSRFFRQITRLVRIFGPYCRFASTFFC